MIDSDDDLKLPMLPNIEESKVNRTIKNSNHFSPFSKKAEETQYRNKTSSPDFNWHLVSAAGMRQTTFFLVIIMLIHYAEAGVTVLEKII